MTPRTGMGFDVHAFGGDDLRTAYATTARQMLSAETIAKQVEAGQGSSTVHIGATAFLGIETDGSNSGSGSGTSRYVSATPIAAPPSEPCSPANLWI